MSAEEMSSSIRENAGHLATRIDDLKWFINAFSAIFALIVAALGIVVGLNLSSEKASLQAFKDELKAEMREALGRSPAPNLVLKTRDGFELNGRYIDAWLGPNARGTHQIHFSYAVANTGRGRSGPIFLKLHSSDIPFLDPDIDGTGFKYSAYIDQEKFSPVELLGGVSMPYTANIEIPESFKSLDEKPDVLMRLYFGNGQMSEARVRFRQKL